MIEMTVRGSSGDTSELEFGSGLEEGLKFISPKLLKLGRRNSTPASYERIDVDKTESMDDSAGDSSYHLKPQNL
jgi:hypothetical protein